MRSNTHTAPSRGVSTTGRPEASAARLRGLLLPAVLTLAALGVLVSLGNWQMRRLAWKEALIAHATQWPAGPVRELPPPAEWPELDVAELVYRPFRLTGRYLHEAEALVFTSLPDANGPEGGPGYWVVTPFVLAGGGAVLVNRGFTPEDKKSADQRGERLGAGPVAVTGLIRPDDPGNRFTPGDKPDANIFFARNIAALAEAKHLPGPVAPFTIDLVAAETPPGGLPQAGETRNRFTNNHLGYAFTWYGLAAALLAVFCTAAWTGLRQPPGEPRLTPPGQAP